jgi:hypothetical protein
VSPPEKYKKEKEKGSGKTTFGRELSLGAIKAAQQHPSAFTK